MSRRRRANAQNVSQHTLYNIQHIHINLTLIHCTFYRYANADQNQFSQGLVFHCFQVRLAVMSGISCSSACCHSWGDENLSTWGMEFNRFWNTCYSIFQNLPTDHFSNNCDPKCSLQEQTPGVRSLFLEKEVKYIWSIMRWPAYDIIHKLQIKKWLIMLCLIYKQ